MLRSLFSGITGLRQHQTLMDVVSNNISNVNTTGFKTSAVVFEDTLSQTMKNSAAPTAVSGGLNPAQVGLGVQLGAISMNFGQGSAQNTGKSTDLMIQGDGFFMVRNGGEVDYTRSGAFTFDTDGTLVNSEGMIVQGWMGDVTTGTVNIDNPVSDIRIPSNIQVPPTASTMVKIEGNITAVPAPAIPPATPPTMTLGATVYDKQGMAHTLQIAFVQNSPPSWDVNVTDSADPATSIGSGTVAFDAVGAPDPANTNITVTLADASATAITLDITKITQFGGPKTLNVTSVDGAASGTLQQFQIGQDGAVLGIFNNGQKLTVAKLALASFNNPPGLEKIGNTLFRSTFNSGLAQVGAPGGGGRGLLLGGALEMSNVDLAQEFTNLIIAQRGFQANSRVITTSDQMLQDLVDLKR